MLVSLHIKEAFEHAWWPATLKKLALFDIPVGFMRLMRSYFRDRVVGLHYSGIQVQKNQIRGCIQGWILSSFLRNLLVDELLSTPFAEGVHLQAYAEDVIIIIFSYTDLRHGAEV